MKRKLVGFMLVASLVIAMPASMACISGDSSSSNAGGQIENWGDISGGQCEGWGDIMPQCDGGEQEGQKPDKEEGQQQEGQKPDKEEGQQEGQKPGKEEGQQEGQKPDKGQCDSGNQEGQKPEGGQNIKDEETPGASKPETPSVEGEDNIPKTGDESQLVLLISLLVVTGVVMAVIIIKKKKSYC